jgi:hypothetical protein
MIKYGVARNADEPFSLSHFSSSIFSAVNNLCSGPVRAAGYDLNLLTTLSSIPGRGRKKMTVVVGPHFLGVVKTPV